MGLDVVPREVRLRVLRILLEPATKGIGFKIGKTRISGYDYETIAILMYLGEVTLAYGNLTDMKDSGGVAYYQGSSVDGASNVLYLPRSYKESYLSLDARSVVVHEATHAALDHRRRALRKLDSEMLAYFAQFWYGMAKGFDYTLADREIGKMSAIVGYGTDCVRQYQANGGKIDEQNLEGFRNAIKAMPLYGDADRKTSPGDGITYLSTTDPLFRAGILSEILAPGGLLDPP